jgi:hypothetical protein
MPEIVGLVSRFVRSKGGKICSPLPAAGPDQRGPNCGFYALNHVMQFWYGKLRDTASSLPEPLPARTHMARPKDRPMTSSERSTRDADTTDGTFTSLRQFGKFHHITAHGSIFNAENMVALARLEGVKEHADKYDARVITTTDAPDYTRRTKALITAGCPVIVPFDVNDDGDPYQKRGKEAHWGVIFGYYTEVDDYFIHYHWGAYRYAKASDFAASTQGLTANTFLLMQKVEIRDKKGKFVDREHLAVRLHAEERRKGYQLTPLAERKPNVEFTNPRVFGGPLAADVGNELLREQGFDPMNLANAGLKNKIVAVFPASLKSSIESVL